MTTLLASGGIAVDFAVIILRQGEAEICSDASARASCGHLWDRDIICAPFQSLEMAFPANPIPDENAAPVPTFLVADQYHVATEMIYDVSQRWNEFEGEMNVSASSFSRPVPGLTMVTVESELSGGSAVARVLTVGLESDSFDIKGTSTVALDQRIYGFRPISSVMMLPLVADYSMATWDEEISDDGTVVLTVAVDTATGLETAGNARVCTLTPAASPYVSVPFSTGNYGQIINGLSLSDLGGFDNNEFSLDVTNRLKLKLPSSDTVTTAVLYNFDIDLKAIAAAVDISLQRRIIPLGRDIDGQRCVTGFVAGRVVGSAVSQSDTTTTLAVTIVPTLFKTATGLIDSNQMPNPWLGKVYRVQ